MNPNKMPFPQEKARASWFITTKSDVQTQPNLRSNNERDPTSRPLIHAWNKKSMEMNTVLDQESERPTTSKKNIVSSKTSLARSPT